MIYLKRDASANEIAPLRKNQKNMNLTQIYI